MKNIPLSVLVVTVAVGAVIGAVTSSLLAPSHDPKSDAPPPVVVEASGSSELEAGLRSLQKASAELLRRIAALEHIVICSVFSSDWTIRILYILILYYIL